MSNSFEVFVKITGQDNFTKAFTGAKNSINKLDNVHKASTNKIKDSNKKTETSAGKLTRAFEKLKVTTAQLGSAMRRTSNQTSLVGSGLDKQKNKIDKQSNLFHKASGAVFSYAKGFVGAYLAVQAAKKGFTDFAYLEKYVKKTQALLHASDTDMAVYTDNIKQHSKSSFNTLSDLFESGFFGAKSGIATKEMSDFVMAVDDIQTAIQSNSNETAQEVAQSFAVIRQSFPTTEIKALKDQYAMLVDTTSNLNVHEVRMGMQKLNMVAKTTGASFASLSSPVALLVSLGQSGSQASTGIQNLTKAFSKYGNKGVAEKLGLKGATLQGSGLIKLLNDINLKYGKLTEEERNKRLNKVFGAEGSIMISQLLPQLDEVNKKFNTINDNSAGFVDNLLKTVKSGAIADLKKLENAFSSLSVAIGKEVSDSGLVKMLTGTLGLMEKIVTIAGELRKSITSDTFFTDLWNKQLPKLETLIGEGTGTNGFEERYTKMLAEKEQKKINKLKEQDTRAAGLRIVQQRINELEKIREEKKLLNNTIDQPTQSVSNNQKDNIIAIEITNNGTPVQIDKINVPKNSKIGLVKQDLKNR